MKRFSLAVCSLVVCVSALAENWPQFRGPRGDGRSLETNVPVQWNKAENIIWKTPVPGLGHSSPIVWSNAIFLTTYVQGSGKRQLLRLDPQTGKLVWQKDLFTGGPEPMHRENNSAASTPATDGMFVYTSFQNGNRVDLRCFDYSGRQIWAAQPLRFEGEHGYGYSPVVYRGLVLFDCRQEGDAAVLALDKATGQVRWRARPGKNRISHVTPLLINDGRRNQMIVCGSDEIRSFDPDTGREWWRCDGPSDVAVAGLAYGNGLVFATAGYPDRTRMAVRVNGQGDVTKTHVAWSLRKQVTYVPSPVYHQGHFYTVTDEGMMVCVDEKTGEAKWDQRLGGRYRSSLILAGGRIYATNDKGLTTVFEASPEKYRSVATNDLQEVCYATPAVSNGRMYIRTENNLYSIAGK